MPDGETQLGKGQASSATERPRNDAGWGRAAVISLWVIFVCTLGLIIEVLGRDVTDRTLVASVAFAGAGGASVAAAVEVGTYLGRQRFQSKWTTYFVVRPILGAGLALLVYFVARGVVLGSEAEASDLNQYGLMALALLCGLSSRFAALKVLESYDALFLRGTGLFRTIKEQQERPGAVTLDRYHGFVAYDLDRVEGSDGWRVTIRMQALRPAGEGASRAQELDVGDGRPAARARFRFTVFSHNLDSVDPKHVDIDVEAGQTLSDSRTFEFSRFASGDDPPSEGLSALIEISQKGQTVGVLSISPDEDR